MSTTIAVLADIHISQLPNTAQLAALDWSIETLVSRSPDIVLVAGDITCSGNVDTARFFRDKLDKSGLNYRSVPGNSDFRTAENAAVVRDLLTVNHPFVDDECAVLLLDAPDRTLSQVEKQRIELLMSCADERMVILAAHYSPSALVVNSGAWFRQLLKTGRIALFVSAHGHVDARERVESSVNVTVRGLDPDKAVGGPPAVAFFDIKDRDWQRHDVSFEDAGIRQWSDRSREEFIGLLGVSSRENPEMVLDKAGELKVPCVELHAPDSGRVSKSVVRSWRCSGGNCLSVHMPDLRWDCGSNGVMGIDGWKAALSCALEMGADRLTMHVPRVSVRDACNDGKALRVFGRVYADLLAPAMARGMTLGVENLHMKKGDKADETRAFGCLPEECLDWVRMLRAQTSYGNIGLHLDIGHARNNPPFSKFIGLGSWYALTGRDIVGYHIHQVLQSGAGMSNHHSFEDVFGPLISLASFFWAWSTGQLSHAPMFLEIRRGGQDMWECLGMVKHRVKSITC